MCVVPTTHSLDLHLAGDGPGSLDLSPCVLGCRVDRRGTHACISEWCLLDGLSRLPSPEVPCPVAPPRDSESCLPELPRGAHAGITQNAQALRLSVPAFAVRLGSIHTCRSSGNCHDSAHGTVTERLPPNIGPSLPTVPSSRCRARTGPPRVQDQNPPSFPAMAVFPVRALGASSRFSLSQAVFGVQLVRLYSPRNKGRVRSLKRVFHCLRVVFLNRDPPSPLHPSEVSLSPPLPQYLQRVSLGLPERGLPGLFAAPRRRRSSFPCLRSRVWPHIPRAPHPSTKQGFSLVSVLCPQTPQRMCTPHVEGCRPGVWGSRSQGPTLPHSTVPRASDPLPGWQQGPHGPALQQIPK